MSDLRDVTRFGATKSCHSVDVFSKRMQYTDSITVSFKIQVQRVTIRYLTISDPACVGMLSSRSGLRCWRWISVASGAPRLVTLVRPLSVSRPHPGEHMHGVTKAQLRFERHPSVLKMFLNMWGERNQRRQCNATSLCQPSSCQTCYYSVW